MTTVLNNFTTEAKSGPVDAEPGSANSCLVSYRRFRTSEREVAEAETSKLLAPHRLQLSSAAHMDAILSWADIGSVSMYLMDYHTQVSIDRPSQSEYMSVVAPLTGQVHVQHRRQDFVARPRQSQAVVSWGHSLHMDVSADCAMLSLRADISALTQALRNLAPDADGPLRFESAVVAPRSCRAISGAMEMMTSVLDSFGSVEAMPTHLRRQLREQALNTVLLTVPHSQSARIFRARPPCRPAVRQAVELIESEATGEMTVSDVAKQVGVGIRALEIGFQHELQCTPRTFMQNKRMERAHQDLQDADPYQGATVTGIALRWGFAHTGRFATTYRRKYGVSPSQTLRQNGGRGPID